MLHGIREGVLAVDAKGAINVLNDEARRLLGLEAARLGQRVEDVARPGRLRRVVTGEVSGPDLVAVTDEHLLVLNRMPVTVGGPQRGLGRDHPRPHRARGAAAPARLGGGADDRAARAGARVLQPPARALGPARARRGRGGHAATAASSRRETALASEEIRARVGSPVVAALLLAKTTVAAERDVVVRLDPASRLEAGHVEDLPVVDGARQPHRQRRRRRGRRPPHRGASPRGEVRSSLTCADEHPRADR